LSREWNAEWNKSSTLNVKEKIKNPNTTPFTIFVTPSSLLTDS